MVVFLTHDADVVLREPRVELRGGCLRGEWVWEHAKAGS
jgi:hypothetical protein